eukprot:m.41545 g.41545  ORF g.41545 m.41545 type:complete len:204 (-) comp8223_c0_seq1:384-995(-)
MAAVAGAAAEAGVTVAEDPQAAKYALELAQISDAIVKGRESGLGASLGELALDVLLELLDDQIYSVIFESHRAYKLKLRSPIEDILPNTKIEGLVDVPGYDIFGRKPEKSAVEAFRCPHCNTPRQPAKFAPHLEKCMGMGGRELRRGAVRSKAQAAPETAPTPPAKRKAAAQPDAPGQSPKVAKLSNGTVSTPTIYTEEISMT